VRAIRSERCEQSAVSGASMASGAIQPRIARRRAEEEEEEEEEGRDTLFVPE